MLPTNDHDEQTTTTPTTKSQLVNKRPLTYVHTRIDRTLIEPGVVPHIKESPTTVHIHKYECGTCGRTFESFREAAEHCWSERTTCGLRQLRNEGTE